MDISAVFEGLASAVNGAQLQGSTRIVSAYPFAPESVMPPHFEVAEFVITYHRTMATEAQPFGMAQLDVTANLLLARGDDESGQQEAQRLASAATDTVIEALEAGRGAPGQDALNGACEDFWVLSARGPRLIDYGEATKFYGVEFSIRVVGR